MNHRLHRLTFRAAVAFTASLAIASTGARAQSTTSDASALSTLPIAVSVAAPVAILSTGAALTVVAVEATGTGVVWVLERVADGTRGSVELVGRAAGDASVATTTVPTAVSTGWVLAAAGEAVAFVPNELGRAMLYNERITR